MRWAVFAIALAFVCCHQGNGLGGPPPPPDLLGPVDLEPPPDLEPPKTCGKIVGCALQCLGSGGLDAGLGNAGCVIGCGQAAPPAEVGAALALIACAAQNCLAGGIGNQLQIFQCLLTSCPMQLAGCQGLGIGGGM